MREGELPRGEARGTGHFEGETGFGIGGGTMGTVGGRVQLCAGWYGAESEGEGPGSSVGYVKGIRWPGPLRAGSACPQPAAVGVQMVGARGSVGIGNLAIGGARGGFAGDNLGLKLGGSGPDRAGFGNGVLWKSAEEYQL